VKSRYNAPRRCKSVEYGLQGAAGPQERWCAVALALRSAYGVKECKSPTHSMRVGPDGAPAPVHC